MKKSTRHFIVERRNARKTQNWADPATEEIKAPAVSDALREANQLFRPRVEKSPAVNLQAETIRVLPDLSAQERSAEAAPVTEPAERKPRGRPRKTAVELPATSAPDEAEAPAGTAASVQEMSGQVAEQDADALDDIWTGDAEASVQEQAGSDEVIIHAPSPEDVIAAVRARTSLRSTRQKRLQAASQLPIGQRWKRRLHPATW